ncbi:hypothetical protein FCT18_07845 [Lysinibacillus sphaericus]|uniref:Uncharacterized protein n=2 Tax=Lysinibacillus sphaericus TaxID=1421 RepID=A0A2S0JYY5_LYSSH|nr:hypothetical protein [Lysinibacillus sphaericus]AVK96337.1 hypothetical protein LS41612_08775 [Lysinibacillus sphaericus]MED4545387.1 hypothetical protein [Lysinibacillus sphaericus]TKI19584.1 hypothetical protein FCT18_07845 [Lysinibacillus sphaericus]GEC84627.1 hypothetical protein LSP03_43700 [Lysinibacillus sphaericus]
MNNITKMVNGGYYCIEWGESVYASDVIQDFWEADKFGNVCKLNIQLLYNSGSKILQNEPKVLKVLGEKQKEKIELNYQVFLDKNKKLDNVRQFLYKDTIIFSYSIENELYLAESYIFRELTEDVFIVFDEQMTLKYLIIEKTSTFNYQNINNDLYNLEAETKYNLIKLYFKIYTYNQNDVVEIQNLIDEIISFKKNTANLDLGISVFLNEEITYLKDELVDSEEV